MATITKTSMIAIVNPLTNTDFVMPAGATVELRQFNFVVCNPGKVNKITGEQVDGAVILGIQVGTKASLVEKPIEFAKEINALQEAMIEKCGSLEVAFLACLDSAEVKLDDKGRSKLVISLSAVKSTFGIK